MTRSDSFVSLSWGAITYGKDSLTFLESPDLIGVSTLNGSSPKLLPSTSRNSMVPSNARISSAVALL